MPKFDVTFWKKATQDDRYSITVEANTPDEAAERVRAYYNAELELSEEEAASECLSKEFCDDSWFDCIDEDTPPRLLEEGEA